MVLTQVMIVEIDERLNGLFQGAHLDQSHFTVFPGETETRVTLAQQGQRKIQLARARHLFFIRKRISL